METEQQNGRFTLFSSKFHYNIYSILFDYVPAMYEVMLFLSKQIHVYYIPHCVLCSVLCTCNVYDYAVS